LSCCMLARQRTCSVTSRSATRRRHRRGDCHFDRAVPSPAGTLELLAAQVLVRVLDVAPQSFAFLRRKRALLWAVLAIAVAVDVAHVVAHALALILAHALLLALAEGSLVAFAALRKCGRRGKDQ